MEKFRREMEEMRVRRIVTNLIPVHPPLNHNFVQWTRKDTKNYIDIVKLLGQYPF